MISHPTYSQAFWKRLKKNKGAMFGLVIIMLSLLLALFGYFIAQDGTPNANRMTVEIGGAKPGFEMSFLKVKNDEVVERPSFFSWLMNGKEDGFNYIPVTSYEIINDNIVVEKYVDEGITERQSYHVGTGGDLSYE